MARDGVRREETIGIWQVLTVDSLVMAVAQVGEPPGFFVPEGESTLAPSSVKLPYEFAKTQNDTPLGRWYGADGQVGFVRPSSHRDIGVLWPEPHRFPISMNLAYER